METNKSNNNNKGIWSDITSENQYIQSANSMNVIFKKDSLNEFKYSDGKKEKSGFDAVVLQLKTKYKTLHDALRFGFSPSNRIIFDATDIKTEYALSKALRTMDILTEKEFTAIEQNHTSNNKKPSASDLKDFEEVKKQL